MFLNTQRITPAWAGKSIRVAPTPRIAGDHPRVGGEKQNVKVCQHFRTGSPPRGRGKVKHVLHAVLDVGITPAWAGKRAGRRKSHEKTGDHPRVGGEKSIPFGLVQWPSGSPPRGRGKD